MYEMFDTVPIGCPAAGSDSVRSSVEANSFVETMNTAVAAIEAAEAARKPQCVTILGSDRRSALTSAWRNAPRKADEKLGRCWAGAAGAAGVAFAERVGAPEVAATAASSSSVSWAACSAR